MFTGQYNPHAKLFYRPIEVAVRWCDLIHHEAQILQTVWRCPDRLATLFPQWPCLHTNIERIFDAIRSQELRYGCLGVPVPMGTKVDPLLLTIRHADLRLWMSSYYPDQKPDFLFGSADDTREKISLGAYFSLQADRDALLREVKDLQHLYQEVLADIQAVGLEREHLAQLVKSHGRVSERSEVNYLQIIGAMLNVILDKSPAGKPFSVFKNQAAFVDIMTAHYPDYPGLSKRTLDQKFAAANRSFKKAL